MFIQLEYNVLFESFLFPLQPTYIIISISEECFIDQT